MKKQMWVIPQWIIAMRLWSPDCQRAQPGFLLSSLVQSQSKLSSIKAMCFLSWQHIKHVGIYLSILKWPSGIFWENSLSLYHLCEIYFYMRWEKFIETSNHLWLLIVFWLFLLACSICAEQCKLLKSQDHLGVCTPVVKPRKKFKSILFSRSHRWIWEKRDGNNAAQQPSEHGSDPARSAWGREGGQ